MIKDIPFYPDVNYRPHPSQKQLLPPKSSKNSESIDINQEINIDFEENFSVSRRLILETDKGQTSHSSKHLRVRFFNQYRQSGIEFFIKTD